MDARAGADVHDVVGGAHGVLVVLDDQNGVAEVAQLPKRGQKLVIVALVQADGRLVENIEHAHQARADLRRQTDALAFAAGERRRRARKRQIAQADRLQKAEARPDLAQDLFGNDGHAALERQPVHEIQLVGDGHGAEIHDVHAADRHGQRNVAQTPAAAFGTRALRHAFLQLLVHGLGLRFGIAPGDVVEYALKGPLQHAAPVGALVVDRQIFLARAVEDGVKRGFRQIADGLGQGEVIFFAERLKIHPGDGIILDVVVAGGLDRALQNGFGVVRNDECRVGDELCAEARADRAGTVGVVEREHARRKLRQGNAAFLAGVVLGEHRVAVAVQLIENDQTAGEIGCRLDGVGQTARQIGLHHQPVHNDLNVVLFVLVERNFLRKLVDAAVHADARIAAAPGVLKDLLMFALFPAHDRREDLELRPLRQLHDLIDNLIDRLPPDLLSALRAVRRAAARPQQAEVVVNFRYGADRGARVFAGGFLVDGDGGRKAVDGIDVRLVHLAEEHPRIARKRLDVAPLALGIDRIKGKRGLAGAGEARQHDQLVARDLQRNIFQIVDARTPHANGILHI